MPPSTNSPRFGIASRGPVVRCALLGLVLALAVLAATGPRAEAGRQWCRTDPLILVDGVPADIFVSVPLEDLLRVNGPTLFEIEIPERVEAYTIVAGVGFGHGEEVWYVPSSNLRATDWGPRVRINVFVPTDGDPIPVLVEVAPRVVGLFDPIVAEGTSNGWISIKTTL